MDELDVVALLVERPELGLKQGQTGTIVHKHSDDVFMVEFVSHTTGYTYALTDLPRSQLIKLVYEGEGIGLAAA